MLVITMVVPVLIMVPVLSWQLLRILSTFRGSTRATEFMFAANSHMRFCCCHMPTGGPFCSLSHFGGLFGFCNLVSWMQACVWLVDRVGVVIAKCSS
jgi:hypothetical protein